MSRPSVLSITTCEKRQAFLREAAALGCQLLTVHKLRDADWPRDVPVGLYTMPEEFPATPMA